MYLKLALAGRVIASAPLDAKEVGNLEYLYTKRSLLTETCCNLIASQRENPVYYIEVSSKMNESFLPNDHIGLS
jgi:hypothetical protein